jgi:hypothetical protein
MKRVMRIINEAAIFISLLAGVYFTVSLLVISLFSQLQNL